MADRTPRRTPTASQTVGPFFHFALAERAAVGDMAGPEVPGERLSVRISVSDGDRLPVSDALIELYQADAEGHYASGDVRPAFAGFGRLATDANGTCVFRTIKPGRVLDHRGGAQAPHVNVCVMARGLMSHLFTRLYFAGDPANDDDAIFNEVTPARRATLLAVPATETPGLWSFDIRLQGAGETVFFQ